MTLPAPISGASGSLCPPIMLLDAPEIRRPTPVFPLSSVPVESVPIQQAVTVSPPFVASTIPSPPNRLITSPLTVVPPAVIVRPLTPAPAAVPTSSIRGTPAYPVWVVPSRRTGSSIVGRAEVGLIVCTPLPAMAKWISSGEPPLGWPLALVIACRSEPAPPSLVFETVNVERRTRGSSASHPRDRSSASGPDRAGVTVAMARGSPTRDAATDRGATSDSPSHDREWDPAARFN